MRINAGDTAWVLTSAALVLLMTPGLALFYGGMVRAKNVLAMLMQNFICMGLIGVLWAVCMYSLAFSGTNKWIGNFNLAFLDGANTTPATGFGIYPIPPLSFSAFQMMFAIITPALITGAIADRMKFRAWVVFLGAWLVLVYAPVAHWVFAPVGWLFQLGALDFAGGTVVHINAAAAAMLGWLVVECLKGGHATTLGAASGAVAGLVAITPCAGYVGGISPIIIGFVAGAVCFMAIQLKFRFGYDDALDVIGVHLVGGVAGSLLLGLFADKAVNPDFGANGLFFGGGVELLGYQLTAVLATLVWSGVISFILAKVIAATIGLRCDDDEEMAGLDLSQHAETAYSFGELGSMGRTG